MSAVHPHNFSEEDIKNWENIKEFAFLGMKTHVDQVNLNLNACRSSIVSLDKSFADLNKKEEIAPEEVVEESQEKKQKNKKAE
jgi:hypothetical protein